MVGTSLKRHERIVFVDPDDDSVSYWWPALIVPEDELGLFRETMDSDIKSIDPDEQLVCYFEDGSFSVVPKSASVPFCPDSEPYTRYAKTVRRFFSDAAIVKATAYWNTGEIPVAFKWLSVLEGNSGGAGGRKRSAVAGEASVVEEQQEDSESEIIDPLGPISTTAVSANNNSNNSTTSSKKPNATGNGVMLPKKKAKTPSSNTTAQQSAKPKVVGRPKKLSDEDHTKPANPSVVRRASVDAEARRGRNVPPVPSYKPSEEEFRVIGHLLPKPALKNLL